MESDVRHLMDEMMSMPVVVGYFWVIEWTEDHLFHAHVAFWLDGNKTQKPFSGWRRPGHAGVKSRKMTAVTIVVSISRTMRRISIYRSVIAIREAFLTCATYWNI